MLCQYVTNTFNQFIISITGDIKNPYENLRNVLNTVTR